MTTGSDTVNVLDRCFPKKISVLTILIMTVTELSMMVTNQGLKDVFASRKLLNVWMARTL